LTNNAGFIGNDLLDDEPVEASAQRSKMLLNRGRTQWQRFNIGGHMQRANPSQLEAVSLAPVAELRDGRHVCRARVLLRMVAAKNSRKCSVALSPEAAMIAGTGNPDQRTAGNLDASLVHTLPRKVARSASTISEGNPEFRSILEAIEIQKMVVLAKLAELGVEP
jgi:hypothetical protein